MSDHEYVFIDQIVLQHPIDVELESDLVLIDFVEPGDLPTQPQIEVL
ncbi:conserved hypothetical protein [Vibrio phage 242E40-1]|nr:conserved hypothetical protein [Vibrio phage 489E54-1]CAH9015811.1 conserved hypothetical protein [Vibrio phage 242E40-1]CAH9015962.1 conserved hypothetical protein [Vibrio phage 381E49-1]